MSQETTIHPKPHAQVILAQINIRHGLEKYREMGNYAILKELKQSDKNAPLPIKKEDMSYEE